MTAPRKRPGDGLIPARNPAAEPGFRFPVWAFLGWGGGQPAEGIRRRLDHLCRLGVDAVWISPIYPLPMADFGYDITVDREEEEVRGEMALRPTEGVILELLPG